MSKTYVEARQQAIDVIASGHGEVAGCVICEVKPSPRSRNRWFSFRFFDADTDGEFVRLEDGTYVRNFALNGSVVPLRADIESGSSDDSPISVQVGNVFQLKAPKVFRTVYNEVVKIDGDTVWCVQFGPEINPEHERLVGFSIGDVTAAIRCKWFDLVNDWPSRREA